MQPMIRHSALALVLVVCFTATIPGGASTHAQEEAPDPAIAEAKVLQDLFMAYQTSMEENEPAKAREAAEKLFAKEPEPWVQVMLAATWTADGNQDEAFRELSAAIASIVRSPIDAGPTVVDLAGFLENGEEWTSLRLDPRFPALLAEAKAATWHPEPLAFEASPATDPPRLKRPATDSEALRTLRETYTLHALVAGAADDLDRVRRVCRWVHARTSHQGWNGDLPDDALGLLQVAEKGGQWRCVEYGVVIAGCLNAVGIPARTVGGQARDVETIAFGAGHVFAEAWLDDRQCWVFVDAQEDIVGVDSDGTPMNSVEFRNSLARENPPIPYPLVLAFCMNHFGFNFEAAHDKRTRVMLGPIGSKMPTKFQRMPTHVPDLFTHRLADVYAAPEPASTPSTRAGADE
jgi:transglutaminase-like putative cysteine protease